MKIKNERLLSLIVAFAMIFTSVFGNVVTAFAEDSTETDSATGLVVTTTTNADGTITKKYDFTQITLTSAKTYSSGEIYSGLRYSAGTVKLHNSKYFDLQKADSAATIDVPENVSKFVVNFQNSSSGRSLTVGSQSIEYANKNTEHSLDITASDLIDLSDSSTGKALKLTAVGGEIKINYFTVTYTEAASETIVANFTYDDDNSLTGTLNLNIDDNDQLYNVKIADGNTLIKEINTTTTPYTVVFNDNLDLDKIKVQVGEGTASSLTNYQYKTSKGNSFTLNYDVKKDITNNFTVSYTGNEYDQDTDKNVEVQLTANIGATNTITVPEGTTLVESGAVDTDAKTITIKLKKGLDISLASVKDTTNDEITVGSDTYTVSFTSEEADSVDYSKEITIKNGANTAVLAVSGSIKRDTVSNPTVAVKEGSDSNSIVSSVVLSETAKTITVNLGTGLTKSDSSVDGSTDNTVNIGKDSYTVVFEEALAVDLVNDYTVTYDNSRTAVITITVPADGSGTKAEIKTNDSKLIISDALTVDENNKIAVELEDELDVTKAVVTDSNGNEAVNGVVTILGFDYTIELSSYTVPGGFVCETTVAVPSTLTFKTQSSTVAIPHGTTKALDEYANAAGWYIIVPATGNTIDLQKSVNELRTRGGGSEGERCLRFKPEKDAVLKTLAFYSGSGTSAEDVIIQKVGDKSGESKKYIVQNLAAGDTFNSTAFEPIELEGNTEYVIYGTASINYTSITIDEVPLPDKANVALSADYDGAGAGASTVTVKGDGSLAVSDTTGNLNSAKVSDNTLSYNFNVTLAEGETFDITKVNASITSDSYTLTKTGAEDKKVTYTLSDGTDSYTVEINAVVYENGEEPPVKLQIPTSAGEGMLIAKVGNATINAAIDLKASVSDRTGEDGTAYAAGTGTTTQSVVNIKVDNSNARGIAVVTATEATEVSFVAFITAGKYGYVIESDTKLNLSASNPPNVNSANAVVTFTDGTTKTYTFTAQPGKYYYILCKGGNAEILDVLNATEVGVNKAVEDESSSESSSEASSESSSESSSEGSSESSSENSSESSSENQGGNQGGSTYSHAAGDLDHSGRADSGDASKVINSIVTSNTMQKGTDEFTIADVNGDGVIDTEDAVCIIKSIVEMNYKFPVGDTVKVSKKY